LAVLVIALFVAGIGGYYVYFFNAPPAPAASSGDPSGQMIASMGSGGG
jgi:hypothetical protein